MLKAKLLKATDQAGLRRFGISIGLALPLLLMGLLPWLFDYRVPLWPVLIPLWLLPLAARMMDVVLRDKQASALLAAARGVRASPPARLGADRGA